MIPPINAKTLLNELADDTRWGVVKLAGVLSSDGVPVTALSHIMSMSEALSKVFAAGDASDKTANKQLPKQQMGALAETTPRASKAFAEDDGTPNQKLIKKAMDALAETTPRASKALAEGDKTVNEPLVNEQLFKRIMDRYAENPPETDFRVTPAAFPTEPGKSK